MIQCGVLMTCVYFVFAAMPKHGNLPRFESCHHTFGLFGYCYKGQRSQIFPATAYPIAKHPSLISTFARQLQSRFFCPNPSLLDIAMISRVHPYAVASIICRSYGKKPARSEEANKQMLRHSSLPANKLQSSCMSG